jgi:hypothetical protein
MLAVLRAEGSLAQRRLQIVNASFFPTPEIHSADDSDRLSDALRAGEEFCRKLGWLTAGGQVGLQLGKASKTRGETWVPLSGHHRVLAILFHCVCLWRLASGLKCTFWIGLLELVGLVPASARV